MFTSHVWGRHIVFGRNLVRVRVHVRAHVQKLVCKLSVGEAVLRKYVMYLCSS